MRKRLERVKKVAGVPVTIDTMKHLSKASKDVLLNNKVSSVERNRRISICHTCEHFSAPRCTLCGCFMNFKTTLESSECPIGKWSSIREATIDDTTCTE